MGWDYIVNEALSIGNENVERIKIKVVGVGGGGCNSISRLSKMGVDAELIAINTDSSSINFTKAKRKILIGKKLTNGRGCGGNMDC